MKSLLQFQLLICFISVLCNTNEDCIHELEYKSRSAIPKIPSSSDFSFASSVTYNKNKSLVLLAGDYEDSKKSDTYHTFFQAYSNDGQVLNYSKSFISKNKPMDEFSLRSFTKIISHPSYDIVFLTGNDMLSAYKASTGDLLWNISINSCTENNDNVLYDSGTFLPNNYDEILVSGTCNNSQTVIIGEYDISNGNEVRRNIFSIYELFPEFASKLNFGLVPPETTIAAPPSIEVYNDTNQIFYYISVSHFTFFGLGRIIVNNDIVFRLADTRNTFINPSFFTHNSMVVDNNDGLITLLDPELFDLLAGDMKHLARYDIDEHRDKLDYNKFVWYGGHKKLDFHLDWTINIDNINYNHIYVSTSPFNLSNTVSYVSQHDVLSGNITGGIKVPFVILDTVVTENNKLIIVGFENNLIKKLKSKNITSTRKAMYSIHETSLDTSKLNECLGCNPFSYGDECQNKCHCSGNGYCNDDLYGDGLCYCTMATFGPTCQSCNCTITNGICDNGPYGTGKCKFCLAIDPFHQSISWSNKYGDFCNLTSKCMNGINNPKGQGGHGYCIYCNDSKAYGKYCEKKCDCNHDSHYCDSGPNGKGCVNYHYGGIHIPYPYVIYPITVLILFNIFFLITYTQARNNLDGPLKCCSKNNYETINDNMTAVGGPFIEADLPLNDDRQVWNENQN